MEKIETFDWGFTDVKLPESEFYASYNPSTGAITEVGPACAFEGIKEKILIDKELALLIIESKVSIATCSINISSGEIEFVETKNAFKIDDVLHRIPKLEYTNFERYDLYIVHDSNKKLLTFELAEDLSGTKKNLIPSKKRKIVWGGETKMYFFVTDYNDPNVVYQTIKFQISDLANNEKTINLIETVPNKFSVYTRRIFENYVIEDL